MVGSEPISNAKKAGAPLFANNLMLRVMSAVVLAPLALVVAYIGGLPFALFWGIAAVVVLWEWMTLVVGPNYRLLVFSCAAAIAVADLLAWLGPGIGATAFEVGADVREAFLARHAESEAAFAPRGPGKWLADLPQLARQQLARAGVRTAGGGSHCTYSEPERFFSYRRDRTTGRMAAVIWREE